MTVETEQPNLGNEEVSEEFPDLARLKRATSQTKNVHRRVLGTTESTQPGELPGIAGRLMEEVGDVPGKYDPPVALSTHTINVVLAGLTAYVFDRIVVENGEITDEEITLLTAALTLHDVNKYAATAADAPDDTSQNSPEVLEWYFEQGDPFGVKKILPGESEDEAALDIADVKWLVQRTETKDTNAASRGDASRRVRGLERYCRIGDGFVSKVHREGLAAGAEWLQGRLADDQGSETYVQHLTFDSLEQSALNNHLLSAVKAAIRGESPVEDDPGPVTHGVVLGSTPDSVVYLGAPIDRSRLRDWVDGVLMDVVLQDHSFNAKTDWRSFEYDILEEIALPFEDKHDIIADGYAATLARGSGTDHEYESISPAFKNGLPELAKVVYRDQNYEEAFDEYPQMTRLWEQIGASETYNNQTRKIGFLAELYRRFQGSVDDGYDPETIRSELEAFTAEHEPGLREDLSTEGDAGSIAVDRFFGDSLTADLDVPSTDEMCFLCGRPAQTEYKKGNDAFYSTSSFSKRVAAEGEYKRICPVCNLEHAILRDTIEGDDYSVDEDIKIAFVYYDEFLADLAVRGSGTPAGLVRALQGSEDDDDVETDLADPQLVARSFSRQYHLRPLYIDSENRRLRAVHGLLDDLVTYGFKVVLGKPFGGFRPEAALFLDRGPSRRQTGLGADRIGSYPDLHRVLRLFAILRGVADTSDYQGNRELTQLEADRFESIADLVARESKPGYEVRELAHEHFLDIHHDKYMKMRDVAEHGFELYSWERDSRHKKTKIMRRAIDATLDGLNRGMDDEALFEHVTGQVYKAATADADQDHFVQPDDAEAFVEALFTLLREEDGLNKEALSQRRNTLTNTYLYTYDRILSERSNSSDDSDAEASS